MYQNWNGNLTTTYSPDTARDFPRTYQDCAERMTAHKANKRNRRPWPQLATNTTLQEWARTHDGATVYGIKYHDTFIVVFHPDGSRVLDSGTWQTYTTRDRMNRAGVRLAMGSGIASVYTDRGEYVFQDAMTILPDGGVSYFGGHTYNSPQTARIVRRRMLARVRRAEKAGKPYQGMDPWYWENRSGGTAHRGNAPEAFL